MRNRDKGILIGAIAMIMAATAIAADTEGVIFGALILGGRIEAMNLTQNSWPVVCSGFHNNEIWNGTHLYINYTQTDENGGVIECEA